MSWYRPADVGFATRRLLGDVGSATRLFMRLLALAGPTFRRFGLVRDVPRAMVVAKLHAGMQCSVIAGAELVMPATGESIDGDGVAKGFGPRRKAQGVGMSAQEGKRAAAEQE